MSAIPTVEFGVADAVGVPALRERVDRDTLLAGFVAFPTADSTLMAYNSAV